MSRIQLEVFKIIKKVKNEGDRALQDATLKFDRVNLSRSGLFPVPPAALKKAYESIPSELRSALIVAKKRIRDFHTEELKNLIRNWSKNIGGISVGQRATPLNRIGIYVPGGRTTYPSTVLMTAIPATVAGVREIIIVTPPQNLKKEMLAACFISGVKRIYGVGGPQAIAALAFGTETVPKVDKIFGPGNRYVAEAKRQLFGTVGIDSLAGPSEVVVWADGSCDPKKIVLNLLAQAEHDPDARAAFYTQDRNLMSKVKPLIPANFLKQIECFYDKNKDVIADKINSLAPEHLWLALKNPKQAMSNIFNAGAIFLGTNTPVALGDYIAGPSHVLPTGKSARFSSGLSVKDFYKWSSVIERKDNNISSLLNAAMALAKAEKLENHYLSLKEA